MSNFLLPPSTLSVVRTEHTHVTAVARPSAHLDALAKAGASLSENVASLYIEMSRSLNEEKLMVHESRTDASTTPTTLEEFAQQVFAPAFRGATAGA